MLRPPWPLRTTFKVLFFRRQAGIIKPEANNTPVCTTLKLKVSMSLHLYTGNIHIHSTYSDGHGTIPEIAAAAKAAGLDFIVVTDHNTLDGLAEEGCHHGVLTLCGSELNNDSHHCLALNITQPVPTDDLNPQRVIDRISSQGGLSFIAHPFERGSPLVMNGLHFPWKRWDVYGFTGIEVWNWSSQWRDALRGALQALYIGYLNPAGHMIAPCQKAVARFDEITRQRPLVAIAGSDNHAWPIRRWGGVVRRVIFPYVYAFRTINNCLLSHEPLAGDIATAKKQLYDALRRGRCFIVNRLLGEPHDVSFTAESNGLEYQIGEQVPPGNLTRLTVRSPRRPQGRSLLFRDGLPFRDFPSGEATVYLEHPGTYRLEVWRGNRLWIFTNPIYVC